MPYVKQLELKHAILKEGRGWIINPLKITDIPGKSSEDLHVVSIKPGAIRGNYHHPDATEWLLFHCTNYVCTCCRGSDEVGETGSFRKALTSVCKHGYCLPANPKPQFLKP